MSKEEQRAPMLSDAYIIEAFRVKDGDLDGYAHGVGAINVANHVRAFYEAKITSGELMVPKTTRLKWIHPDPKHREEVEIYGVGHTCVSCQTRFFLYADVHTRPNFCPGCGAKIIL